jgi:hypothetical protein
MKQAFKYYFFKKKLLLAPLNSVLVATDLNNLLLFEFLKNG